MEIYFPAADVFVRYDSFQYTMSPQRKASAVHTLIFSNQRHGSLDPAMTNADLTDEEIPLTSVPPRVQKYVLTIRELIDDYLDWTADMGPAGISKWDSAAVEGRGAHWKRISHYEEKGRVHK